jgi:hypothetical protein
MFEKLPDLNILRPAETLRLATPLESSSPLAEQLLAGVTDEVLC